MNLKVANNLDEYIEIVNELKFSQENIWFRGMSSAKYTLVPSLFREKEILGLKYSGREIDGHYYRKSDAIMQSDTKFIEKFIEHYNNKFPDESKNFNLIEYLFLMQHYDIPTRLLDFSSDEMIALYFSVSSNIDLDKDSCNESEIKDFYKNNGVTNQGSSVHCIDPKLTNYYTNKFKNLKDDILNIDDITLDILLKIDLPLCIKTNNQNDRIKAQKGFFVLFGSDYKGYDEYTVLREKITKIFIPNSSRAKIKAELKQRYNISHSTIYPDMKGIALEITEEIKQDYKERLRIFQDK